MGAPRLARSKIEPGAVLMANEQVFVTICFNNSFYASGADQLAKVMELSKELDAEFIAKTAVCARENASMKDLPALLLAVLSTKSPEHLRRVFDRVIDTGGMLRTFVQIIRSGAVGRKSLGSAPKALVQKWLSSADDRRLIDAAVGSDPSLADIVRMVHPKPNDPMREAFYGWLLGKPCALEALPRELQDFVAYQRDRSQEFPDVPSQRDVVNSFAAGQLSPDQWIEKIEEVVI
jgi:60 kDa SS-A/Ro ribonucleoprotein